MLPEGGVIDRCFRTWHERKPPYASRKSDRYAAGCS